MSKIYLGFHAGTAGKATQKTVQGLIRHTLRKREKTKNHSNENIDKSRTKYNIDYVFGKDRKSTKELIDERLENDYKGKRRLRKDQVIIREVITQPSKEFFEGMTIQEQREQMKRFVTDALPWFREEFGAKNIVGASAHLDEANPHAHIMILPMTKDGRVSQTDFFKGPKQLAAQHKSYREHMISKGWEFEKENKYEDIEEYDTPTYKANAEKIEKARQEQTEAIRGLLSDDEIRQEATEIVLNEILRSEREKMANEKEHLETLRNDAMGYFKAVVSNSTAKVDLNVLEDAERNGIGSISPNKYGSTMRYAIMDAVEKGNTKKMMEDVNNFKMEQATQESTQAKREQPAPQPKEEHKLEL